MTSIMMRVASRPDGADVAEAEHNGRTFRAVSRNGATLALARDLVAAGAPDTPWQAIGPDGRMRFGGRSLHRLARLTIAEGDDGLRIRRWTARETMPAQPAQDAASGAERRAA